MFQLPQRSGWKWGHIWVQVRKQSWTPPEKLCCACSFGIMTQYTDACRLLHILLISLLCVLYIYHLKLSTFRFLHLFFVIKYFTLRGTHGGIWPVSHWSNTHRRNTRRATVEMLHCNDKQTEFIAPQWKAFKWKLMSATTWRLWSEERQNQLF